MTERSSAAYELLELFENSLRDAYRAGWRDAWAEFREGKNAPRASNRDASAEPGPCQEDAATGNPLPIPEAAPPEELEPGEDGGPSRVEAHISEGGEDDKAEPGTDPRASPHTVDCATLEPLTRGEWDVFRMIVALRGEYATGTEMAIKCGHPVGSVTGHLVALVRKRYVVKRSAGRYCFAYDVACRGAPVINEGRNTKRTKAPQSENHASFTPQVSRPEPAAPQDPQIVGDPPAGSSVFDKAQAIAELKIPEYLDRKGHQVRAYPSGRQFNIDGTPRDLRYTIELVNKYRAKSKDQPLDVARYL